MSLRVAVVVPPFINLNAPYASVPRLTGWLRAAGHSVEQHDLSIELFLRCLSRDGLTRLFGAIDPDRVPPSVRLMYYERARYIAIIDEIIAFLQGRNPSVAHRLCGRGYVPMVPNAAGELTAVGLERFGLTDGGRYVATHAILNLIRLFRETISPGFHLSSYHRSLATEAREFGPLDAHLAADPDPVETLFLEIANERIGDVDLIAVTCPFVGNLMAALRLGQWSKRARPSARIALGGGYPTTELRDLAEPRVFDHVDYVVLDDGELPLQQICDRLEGRDVPLHRTFTRDDGEVAYHIAPTDAQPRFRDLPAPDYDGLRMDWYVDLVEELNVVGRLWNEGRWLRLTAAHGCYWKRCTFCDIHLSYIRDYEPLSARNLADQMDALHAQTRLTGFHFTDEAAPPSLMVNLALELLRRGRSYHFWGNIRFDPDFTADRCRLLAAAGMIAVTGGIEVASDKILPIIDKGITVHQAAKVCQAFSDAGIFVHAYLMQSFPGESLQDTVDALETVRQLMRAGVLHCGFFHKFLATAHSPIGREPERFGVRIKASEPPTFANYCLRHVEIEPEGPWQPFSSHARQRQLRARVVDDALETAMNNYLQGRHLDDDVAMWFDGKLPATTIRPTYIEELLKTPLPHNYGKYQRLVWLGTVVDWTDGQLTAVDERGAVHRGAVSADAITNLKRCHPRRWSNGTPPRYRHFDRDHEAPDWYEPLLPMGLLVV